MYTSSSVFSRRINLHLPHIQYISFRSCLILDIDFFFSNISAVTFSDGHHQIKSILSSMPTESAAASVISSATPSETTLPKTIILGFSKGGIVLNQIIAELAHMEPQSSYIIQDHICPISKDELLSTISEIHYIDVGLNRTGAYLTEKPIIKKAVENLLVSNDQVRFILHGTPRQWCDKNRPWIRKEKDFLLKLLIEEAQRSEGKLQAIERYYSINMPPSLQMHFEIIESMDIS